MFRQKLVWFHEQIQVNKGIAHLQRVNMWYETKLSIHVAPPNKPRDFRYVSAALDQGASLTPLLVKRNPVNVTS